jgi:hypothetical protein
MAYSNTVFFFCQAFLQKSKIFLAVGLPVDKNVKILYHTSHYEKETSGKT